MVRTVTLSEIKRGHLKDADAISSASLWSNMLVSFRIGWRKSQWDILR